MYLYPDAHTGTYLKNKTGNGSQSIGFRFIVSAMIVYSDRQSPYMFIVGLAPVP